MIRVRIVDGSRSWSIEESRIKAGDILKRIGLLSEEYIIVKNGKVITPDDEVVDGEEIILYPVVSGG